MELRLDARLQQEAVQQAKQLLHDKRLVVVFGDRLTLCSFVLAEPINPSLVGAATTEEEGFQLVLRTQPDLLICSSDLETGYGPDLLRRVKTECPTCQLMIVLVRETQAVVQEALQAYADAVIFKSSLGTGQGDLIQALQTLSEGGVYFPEQIRRMASLALARQQLPPLVEELTPREIEVVDAVSRGLKNNAIADLFGISIETVKTHVGNAMDKLGARDRTQMAVSALSYGLIDPIGR
ncbi:MAG: response regulator transcription factor [Synechococcus sp.]|nr:response regulator transcription factor [Synechococcus sp.]